MTGGALQESGSRGFLGQESGMQGTLGYGEGGVSAEHFRNTAS